MCAVVDSVMWLRNSFGRLRVDDECCVQGIALNGRWSTDGCTKKRAKFGYFLSLIKQDGGRLCGVQMGYMNHKKETDRALLKGKMECTAPVLHCLHVFLPEMTPLLHQIPLHSRISKMRAHKVQAHSLASSLEKKRKKPPKHGSKPTEKLC